jgi:hypothetical protein
VRVRRSVLAFVDKLSFLFNFFFCKVSSVVNYFFLFRYFFYVTIINFFTVMVIVHCLPSVLVNNSLFVRLVLDVLQKHMLIIS